MESAIHNLYTFPDVIRSFIEVITSLLDVIMMMKLRRIRCMGHLSWERLIIVFVLLNMLEK
jgi:hypothetical protein